jgi:hypothetical protein
MANTTAPNDTAKSATGDYSATKAPENREHVTSEARTGHPTLTPGGPHGAPVDVGMEAIEPENGLRDEIAATKRQADYGINPAEDRRGTGKE